VTTDGEADIMCIGAFHLGRSNQSTTRFMRRRIQHAACLLALADPPDHSRAKGVAPSRCKPTNACNISMEADGADGDSGELDDEGNRGSSKDL
jgi:hypothetical protein